MNVATQKQQFPYISDTRSSQTIIKFMVILRKKKERRLHGEFHIIVSSSRISHAPLKFPSEIKSSCTKLHAARLAIQDI